MIEDTNNEINQLNAERKAYLEARLDQMSSRLDKLEALKEDEQRHWESLVQELISMRKFMRTLFKA
ncbi:MAG TPA: hypothetical protein VL866_05005 [Pyrinomonadaceae bacterium]|nr:hypothetical protein [Pyrinomonadaceae bacterium]